MKLLPARDEWTCNTCGWFHWHRCTRPHDLMDSEEVGRHLWMVHRSTSDSYIEGTWQHRDAEQPT